MVGCRQHDDSVNLTHLRPSFINADTKRYMVGGRQRDDPPGGDGAVPGGLVRRAHPRPREDGAHPLALLDDGAHLLALLKLHKWI